MTQPLTVLKVLIRQAYTVVQEMKDVSGTRSISALLPDMETVAQDPKVLIFWSSSLSLSGV